jgi:hypothetical protein
MARLGTPSAGVVCRAAGSVVRGSSPICFDRPVDKSVHNFGMRTNKGAGLQYPRSHAAATDLKPADSARRGFLTAAVAGLTPGRVRRIDAIEQMLNARWWTGLIF